MNKITTILFLLILPVFLLSQNNWQEIGGKEVQFTAEMYSLTKQKVDTLFLEEAPVLLYSWTGEPKDKEHPVIEYKLKSSNYPSSFIDSDSSFLLVEGFLNSTILDLLENPKYEIMTASVLFLDGYPGKEFKFKELATNNMMEVESYLIHSQLLELITVSRSENWFSNNKSRFYESVKLLDRPENKADYGIPIIKHDSYTVNFPSTPEITNLFVEREEGYVNSKTYILEQDATSGVAVYMASEAKYPKGFTVKPEEMDDFYENSMRGSINSMNGEFISKKEINYKNGKGIEFLASIFNGEAKSCFRAFYQDGTMYIYGFLFLDEKINEEGKKFFDSFEIK